MGEDGEPVGMRRRELLASAGAVMSAGCVGTLVGGKWGDEHIHNVNFPI